MTRLTDGEIEIVAEIGADCEPWGEDAMIAAIFELDLPCERCGKPATGFSATQVTCDDCALIVAREHYGEVDMKGALDDVLFPGDEPW